MVLEGVVTNVTAFGAFVDIGVHQDGLVHISAMSRKFIRDAREVVKAGDVVKVKVMEVDLARRRVALTMRLDDSAAGARQGVEVGGERRRSGGREDVRGGGARGGPRQAPAPAGNALADAFSRALTKR
jgi:uncharacterized protein